MIRFISTLAFDKEKSVLLPLLEEAFQQQHDETSLEVFLRPFYDGSAILLAIEDEHGIHTVVLGEWLLTAKGKGFRITLSAGTFVGSQEELTDFGAFLKSHGYSFIEGWVRPSVQRLLTRFGFAPVYIIVRKEL